MVPVTQSDVKMVGVLMVGHQILQTFFPLDADLFLIFATPASVFTIIAILTLTIGTACFETDKLSSRYHHKMMVPKKTTSSVEST